ncbi:MAG: LPS-assembly lipoprotein LptE [Methylosarcina sp.]
MLYKKTVILIFSLVLSACGYHLRGSTTDLSTEINAIYWDGGTVQLREQLTTVLGSSTGKLAASPEEAGLAVKILNEDFRRRILSLSSRGRSNEVELDYFLEYELSKGGKVLLERQPIRLRREYFNDQQDIIAKDNEEKVIRTEMYQQAIQNILTRARMELQASSK